MSSFALKLIAFLTMLIDHTAYVFGWEGWDLLPVNASLLRCIGRLSFPIFAFCLVNGWTHTRNRHRYLIRLTLCALLSQIPFSLAFYPPNHMPLSETAAAFGFRFSPILLAVAAVSIGTYWYFAREKVSAASLLTVSAACLLPVFCLKIDSMWIQADSLNVLYTLALGAAMLFTAESLREKRLRRWEAVWLIAVLTFAIVTYGLNADYGYRLIGLILIAALYAARNRKTGQFVVIVLWGCAVYGLLLHNWDNALATAFSATLVFCYNGNPGCRTKLAKNLFYAGYPLHLLLLGACNAILKLG